MGNSEGLNKEGNFLYWWILTSVREEKEFLSIQENLVCMIEEAR